MFGKEIRRCLGVCWLVVSGTVLSWVGSEVSLCHVSFVGRQMVMDLVEIRENPEFHDLMRMDKGHWPRSLLWHVWLPLLSGANGASPWAESGAQGAGHMLDQILGPYSLIGVCLMSLMLLMLRCRYVSILMCGLMVDLLLMRSLVSPLWVLGSILTFLGIDGVHLSGVILMILVLLVV